MKLLCLFKHQWTERKRQRGYAQVASVFDREGHWVSATVVLSTCNRCGKWRADIEAAGGQQLIPLWYAAELIEGGKREKEKQQGAV